MSTKKTRKIAGILLVVILASVVFVVFRNERRRANIQFARSIAAINPRGGTPRTIEGLRRAIALYEAQIQRHVREGAQTGVYWKILGIRLADGGMHRDALAAFERAIHFNAEDATIFYLSGISAAIVANSIIGFSPNAQSEREHFFQLSENAHRRALQLDAQFLRPMYALGVLYAFNLERPQEAIPLLETYLRAMPNDIEAMFVLARAHFMTGGFEAALELYDRIISRTRDENARREARNNMQIVWSHMYG